MANQTKNASFCTLGVCGKVFVGMRLKRATCFLPAMRLGPTLCSSSSFACLCCGIAKPTLSMWREVEATIVSSSFMLQQRKGFLTYQDFQKGMERFGYTITEQDALAIARYFDSTKDGKVDFEEFCKGMLELQGPFLANSQRLSDALHSDIKGYGETAKVEFTKLEDIRAIKRSFKLLQARLYQQPRMLQLLTKEFARSSLGRKVPLSEAVQVFDRCGFEQSHEEIRSIVQELLPGTEGDEIDYIDLISLEVYVPRSLKGIAKAQVSSASEYNLGLPY
ncbi:hypothetical protein, conserved [Eimeria tenella]|uniref:EF-hand domain-containing protein n=1 Tax=Eimeria tenella TaxID=5802 RepID=U6KSQ7_EIMTE|nr:hypothetical protein, conserved [Eimeria tenella]CDJ40996.1 hypothetical protein, conserved [Eimeria tenella]|eukprot:XP_013231746.1 hypothetical protein, conserved [Eimeria tenella]